MADPDFCNDQAAAQQLIDANNQLKSKVDLKTKLPSMSNLKNRQGSYTDRRIYQEDEALNGWNVNIYK